jgi:hypothetical protein
MSEQPKNWRFVITGIVLIILALAFYLFMVVIAPRSTDPVAVLQTAGTVSGVASGLATALIVLGLLGKRFS